MKAIAPNGDLKVGGLAWQPSQTMQGIGIPSLQSKVLCTSHNSSLSGLDAEANKFVEALIAVDKNPNSLAQTTEFSGDKLELWLLKVICGTNASGGFRAAPVQNKLKEILVGGVWPPGWGMYAGPSTTPEIFTRDLLVETSVNPTSGEILAAFFRIAGVGFNLLLGKPDNPDYFGIYRPRGFAFQTTEHTLRLGLNWRVPTNDKAVVFTRLGTTTDQAPHTFGWKEQGSEGGA